MSRRRSIPKRIHGVLKSGAFHPVYGGSYEGTTGARIGGFHLVTNQEGNQRGVRRCVYRLSGGRDIVGPLVAKEAHTLSNPSDMPNLEFRVQINFSFMDGLLQVSSTHSAGGRWRAPISGPVSGAAAKAGC